MAIKNNTVCGYAYASQYKERSAYRFTVESSVYIAPDQLRCGLGKALMKEIIFQCTKLGFREMMAIIGDSENYASISLHESLGFGHIGIAHGIGVKFDRPIDVVFMQRPLQRSP